MSDTPTFSQRIFEMLMQSQYWPPEQMLEFQRSQLSQLLRHAKATVPFYKTRLDVVFNGNGEIDWGRWNELPIVTRADLRDRRDEMLAATLPPGHGPTKTFSSSGSSGVPIAMEATNIGTAANATATFRLFENQGIDTRKSLASLSNFTKRGDILHEDFYVGRWGRSWGDANQRGRKIVINRNLTETHKLQLLESAAAAYLQDIPNNAEVLAIANLHRKNPLKLEVIMCVGQGVTKEQKILFKESFGARCLSIYSSKEGGIMGCQCGDGPHFHINSEFVLVEILTPDGKPCSPGEHGRVVITPFFSTALPLVRYDQGDTAEMLNNCSCDSKLPLLREIIGRQDQLLRFPEGMRAVVGLNQDLLRRNLNALVFQLAQTAPLKLEVRYVPVELDRQVNVEPIVAHIHQLIHSNLEVTFKQVEKIPLNSGGKQQRIVCEIA